MNERIEKLAISRGIYDSLCDPYDSHKNGDYYSSVMDDLERFAKLIIQECSELTLDHKNDDYYNGWLDYREQIKKHFGIEE